MALLMEGELTFSWDAGFVHVQDEAGQRACIRLAQFHRALEGAKVFEESLAEKLRTQRRAQVVALGERGTMFLVERPD